MKAVSVEPSRLGDVIGWTDCVTGLTHQYSPREEWLERPSPGKDSYVVVHFGKSSRWFKTNDQCIKWCINSGYATLDNSGSITATSEAIGINTNEGRIVANSITGLILS